MPFLLRSGAWAQRDACVEHRGTGPGCRSPGCYDCADRARGGPLEEVGVASGLSPDRHRPDGRPGQETAVVARWSTPGPRAVTGVPAGTNAERPFSTVTSASADVRTAVPSVHSSTWGPAVVSVPECPSSWEGGGAKPSTGTGNRSPPGPSTGWRTGTLPSVKSSTSISAARSTCLPVSPPRSTLSELAITSTPAPDR